MIWQQLSVPADRYAPGEILSLLESKGLPLWGLTLSEVSGRRFLHLLANAPEEAQRLLLERRITFMASKVLLVLLPEEGACGVLRLLSRHGVNPEYFYLASLPGERLPLLALRVREAALTEELLCRLVPGLPEPVGFPLLPD